MAAGQIPVIIKYFRTLNISSLSLLLCLSEDLKTLTLRQMSDEGFQISFGLNGNTGGAAMNLSCNRQVFQQTTGIEIKDEMEGEWLVFGTRETATALPVLPDSRITLVGEGDDLMDIFKPAKSSALRLANYTGCRDHSNFGGVTLHAVALEDKKTAIEGKEVGQNLFGEFGCLSKRAGGWTPYMSEALVDHLSQQLNFKVKRRNASDCDSLNIFLSNGQVDFSSTAVMMTEERMEHSRFTGDLYELKSKILFKQPRLSVMRNIYLLPFHENVWLCCLALFLLCFALLLVATLTSPGAFEKNMYSTPLELLSLLIGVASQQGIPLGAESLSTRMTLLLFSVSSLFLCTSYSANIVALIQSGAETVTSVADLTASPLRVAMEDCHYNKIYLQESDGYIKELNEKKIVKEQHPFISAAEGIEKLKSELIAFQVETSLAYQLMSKTYTAKEKCDLSELDIYTFPKFSIPVVSGYRELFTSRLSWQRECGLIKREENRALFKKPACTTTDSGFISVTFEDFFPGLLVLCWGFGAAIAAFLAELVVVRCSLAAQHERKKYK